MTYSFPIWNQSVVPCPYCNILFGYKLYAGYQWKRRSKELQNTAPSQKLLKKLSVSFSELQNLTKAATTKRVFIQEIYTICKETVLLLLHILGSFLLNESQSTMYMWVHFWAFYSVPLICVSVFMPKPCIWLLLKSGSM